MGDSDRGAGGNQGDSADNVAAGGWILLRRECSSSKAGSSNGRTAIWILSYCTSSSVSCFCGDKMQRSGSQG